MLKPPRVDFNTTPLDPHLLSTSFQVQTNWHFITGAPCSGKTTLIDLLAARGFQTMPEVGRKYIESEIAKERTLEEIRADQIGFARRIPELTLELERTLRPEDTLFLDRAIPDALAFHRLIGLDLNEVLPDCFYFRYASVFVLDHFPTQKDCVRVKDDVESEFLDIWLERSYRSLGYNVVRVPVLPPEGRLQFVVDRVS